MRRAASAAACCVRSCIPIAQGLARAESRRPWPLAAKPRAARGRKHGNLPALIVGAVLLVIFIHSRHSPQRSTSEASTAVGTRGADGALQAPLNICLLVAECW